MCQLLSQKIERLCCYCTYMYTHILDVFDSPAPFTSEVYANAELTIPLRMQQASTLRHKLRQYQRRLQADQVMLVVDNSFQFKQGVADGRMAADIRKMALMQACASKNVADWEPMPAMLPTEMMSAWEFEGTQWLVETVDTMPISGSSRAVR